MFKKEADFLVLVGFFEREKESEWGAPSFAQPRPKTNWEHFLNDFINLNKKIKRKPYPIPKINKMLWKFEGFQYYTSLDLNVGYYHIWFRYNASNLCMIILSWVKYCSKRLTMRVANSPDIFQQKMNDLFCGFQFICAYIYEILVFKKVEWTYHVHKLELTLNKLN